MVSKPNSLFLLLLILPFNGAVLIFGDSPTPDPDTSPAPPPAPESSAHLPTPSPNTFPTPAPSLAPVPISSISSPASSPSQSDLPPNCRCPDLDPDTMVACAIVVIQHGTGRLPLQMCCKGLVSLKEEDIYGCLCYILRTNIAHHTLAKLTIPTAVKIVAMGCRPFTKGLGQTLSMPSE